MDIQLPSDIEKRIREYKGDPWVIENAVGAYVIGQFYGWRVLRLLHVTPSTMRKYEKALGIKFQKRCPEWTPLSERCRGIRIAKQIGAYWRVVRGAVPGPDRRLLDT